MPEGVPKLPVPLDLALQVDGSVRHRAIEDELVVYHPATDTVTRLNHVSAVAWTELREPLSTNELLLRLAELFSMEPSQIFDDVRGLVEDLIAAQLVHPAKAPSD